MSVFDCFCKLLGESRPGVRQCGNFLLVPCDKEEVDEDPEMRALRQKIIAGLRSQGYQVLKGDIVIEGDCAWSVVSLLEKAPDSDAEETDYWMRWSCRQI